jgi:hypothetical protein
MAYRQNVPSGGSGALSMPGRQVATALPASAAPHSMMIESSFRCLSWRFPGAHLTRAPIALGRRVRGKAAADVCLGPVFCIHLAGQDGHD